MMDCLALPAYIKGCCFRLLHTRRQAVRGGRWHAEEQKTVLQQPFLCARLLHPPTATAAPGTECTSRAGKGIKPLLDFIPQAQPYLPHSTFVNKEKSIAEGKDWPGAAGQTRCILITIATGYACCSLPATHVDAESRSAPGRDFQTLHIKNVNRRSDDLWAKLGCKGFPVASAGVCGSFFEEGPRDFSQKPLYILIALFTHPSQPSRQVSF